MPKFAVCDRSFTIWQYDTSKPSQLPFSVHESIGVPKLRFQSLAFASDKQFSLVGSPPGPPANLYKTQTADFEVLIYDFNGKAINPQCIRVRSIGFGQERTYFSAQSKTSTGGVGGCDSIFYLENGVAIPYTQIDYKQLIFPNPTDPGGPNWYWWEGDFDFGGVNGDTLYLSTGGLTGYCHDVSNPKSMTVGLYKIDGAGADTVTGVLQCIYQPQSPIFGLCYRSPNKLYFLRQDNAIWSLDLNIMQESLVGSFNLPESGIAMDLVEIGDGLQPMAYWPLISSLILSLHWFGNFMWKLGKSRQATSARR
jgi:hypothetical protein